MMTDIPTPVGETAPSQRGHPDAPCSVPHTQIHFIVRRTLENLQDVVVTLLMVLPQLPSPGALWRLSRMAIRETATTELLAEIVFVLILTEVYRLLVYYLRDHIHGDGIAAVAAEIEPRGDPGPGLLGVTICRTTPVGGHIDARGGLARAAPSHE